jgi:hypothetical protein
MPVDRQTEAVARALLLCVGLLRRRLRQTPVTGELTFPETAALGRLDRGGPAAAADLARQEQISPQSMGATLAELEARGLVKRQPDPGESCCPSAPQAAKSSTAGATPASNNSPRAWPISPKPNSSNSQPRHP